MEQYPKRPPFFSHRFVRLMAKVCLANEIGPEACWMLTLIAHTEDAKSYRDAVTYWNEHLFPLVGLGSVSALKRLRSKIIKAGWLYYEKGCKGRAPRYWVVIPERFEGMDDGPTGQDDGVIFREDCGSEMNHKVKDSGPPLTQKADEKRTECEPESGQKADRKRATFIPIPDPPPSPDSASPETTPPVEGKKPGGRKKKEPVPRERCPLFDTLAEMTGTDPKVSGSYVASVRNQLLNGEPPYTPDELRALPAALTANKLDVPFTLGVVEKYIGLTRKTQPPPAEKNGVNTLEEIKKRDEYLKREREREEKTCLDDLESQQEQYDHQEEPPEDEDHVPF